MRIHLPPAMIEEILDNMHDEATKWERDFAEGRIGLEAIVRFRVEQRSIYKEIAKARGGDKHVAARLGHLDIDVGRHRWWLLGLDHLALWRRFHRWGRLGRAKARAAAIVAEVRQGR